MCTSRGHSYSVEDVHEICTGFGWYCDRDHGGTIWHGVRFGVDYKEMIGVHTIPQEDILMVLVTPGTSMTDFLEDIRGDFLMHQEEEYMEHVVRPVLLWRLKQL